MTKLEHLTRAERMTLRVNKREITDLLKDLPSIADEHRAGMNREDDIRDILNTILGLTDQIAQILEVEL